MNYFILVATDSYFKGGASASAEEIALFRLSNKVWPLYNGTRNKEVIEGGDRALIYVGGSKSRGGEIVASCTIKKIKRNVLTNAKVDLDGVLTERPDALLTLSKIHKFKTGIEFRKILPKLECAPKNLKKWGIVLIGGVRRISSKDFNVLSDCTNLLNKSLSPS